MYISLTDPDKQNLKMSVLFGFTEIIHSVINTLTMQYFTYNRHNIFKINFPNLITVEFVLFMGSGMA